VQEVALVTQGLIPPQVRLPEKSRRLQQRVPDAPSQRDSHQQPSDRHQAPLTRFRLRGPALLRHRQPPQQPLV